MRKITLSEYNAIPENYRGIWTVERWDLPDWAELRKKHIGKRTMMVYDKGTCLLVEGIGFDTNLHCVEMVETGELDALIAQNPFAIGYLGVKAACDLVSDAFVYGDQKELYTDVTTVTRDNLYDSDIQKILFRFQ